MVKNNSVKYICKNCGAESQVWSGKCYQCGEWNTLEEQIVVATKKTNNSGNVLKSKNIGDALTKDYKRIATSISEIDLVFGGGIVAGSVNLIAGQPGIGKSTLLLQLAHKISNKYTVLYISGEESAHQIGIRAQRLGVTGDKLKVANSTSAEDIAATIADSKYKLVIVDSIQTLECSHVTSPAGSVSQIINSTHLLTNAAKTADTAVIIVGHVNKEGTIAGPKVLEHIVDVVMQLEGDRYGGLRVLRAEKNRYGSTNETGIFEMADDGLRAIINPSAALLAERQIADGSVVLATIEGTRPLLVEVQALVNRTNYGYPKRTASGVDINRVNLLVAMLEKRTKLNLSEQDIYINIVGGIRISEPAADLAITMAIASATKNMVLQADAVVFGELGLSGEIRHVPYIEKRIAEAKKLGFNYTIGPPLKTKKKFSGHTGVRDIKTALNTFLKKTN